MNDLTLRNDRRSRSGQAGFTLIELMIAVVIIAILSAIVVPMYRNYVISGDLTEATNTLSALRAKMEQYYQDNRTYQDGTSTTSPCDSGNLTTLNGGLKYFTVTCPASTWTTTGYQLVATGISTKITTGFSYTLDNFNNQSSTMGSTWGSTVCSSTWKTSKSGGC